MTRAIIIGASYGIGRELAKILSENNYTLGLAARSTDKLLELQQELPGKSYIKYIDVTQNKDAKENLNELICELGGLDLIVISSGMGYIAPVPNWETGKENVEVNICGFMAVADEALKFFIKQDAGHIVGISSIADARCDGSTPAYNASKVFVTNYLEGIRQKVNSIGANIHVTDIRPGLVNSKSANEDGSFWAKPPERAVHQIYNAIIKKKKNAYVAKRWNLLAKVLRFIQRD